MLRNLTANEDIIKLEAAGYKKLGNNTRNENSFKSPYSKGEKVGEQYKSGDEMQRFRDAQGKFAAVANMERSQEMVSKAKEMGSEETRRNSEKKDEENRDKKREEYKGALENEKQREYAENKEASAEKNRAKSLYENEEKSSQAESTNYGKNIPKENLHDYRMAMSQQTSEISNNEKDKEMKPKEMNNEDKRKNEEASKEHKMESVLKDERKDSKSINLMYEEAKAKGKETKEETNANIYKNNITQNIEVKNEKQESSKEHVQTENRGPNIGQNEKSQIKEHDRREGENFDDDIKKGEKVKVISNERKNATSNRENENVGTFEVGQQKVKEEKLENENHKMRSTEVMKENEQVSSFTDSLRMNGNNTARAMESKNESKDLHSTNIENGKGIDLNFEKVAKTKSYQYSTPNTSKEVANNNSNDKGKDGSYYNDVEINNAAAQNNTNGTLSGREENNKTREHMSENSANWNENKTETEKIGTNQMRNGYWSFKEEREKYESQEDKINKAYGGNKNDHQRKIELGVNENIARMRNEKEKGAEAFPSDADRSKETKINQNELGKNEKSSEKEPRMREDARDGKYNKKVKEAMKEGNMAKFTETNQRSIKGEKMWENSQKGNDGIKKKAEYKGSKREHKKVNEDGKYQGRHKRKN